MNVHLINPSHVSFGTAVITPRWLYVLAGATPARYGDPILVDETLALLDPATIQPGDIVGIGVHTGNALRGYEVGRAARASGAYVVYGGIHATLYPEEALELGGAHAVVKGDGDVVWATVLADCLSGTPKSIYEGGRIDADQFSAGALGPDPAQELHVGLGADRSRMPQALFVLLGVAHRRTEAPPETR